MMPATWGELVVWCFVGGLSFSFLIVVVRRVWP